MSTSLRLLRSLAAAALLPAALPPAVADAAADARAARARHFVEQGPDTTLAACDLPRTCAHQAPLRETRESEDAAVDRRRLAFEGLEVELLYASDKPASAPAGRTAAAKTPSTAPHRPVVLELTVTGMKWPVAEGLVIGTPRADVERLLGNPGDASDACVTYADADTQDDAMLCYAGDRLIAIKWSRWNE